MYVYSIYIGTFLLLDVNPTLFCTACGVSTAQLCVAVQPPASRAEERPASQQCTTASQKNKNRRLSGLLPLVSLRQKMKGGWWGQGGAKKLRETVTSLQCPYR